MFLIPQWSFVYVLLIKLLCQDVKFQKRKNTRGRNAKQEIPNARDRNSKPLNPKFQR